MENAVLIFDGACGFCARSVAWIRRRDREHRLSFVPSQMPGVLDRYGLTREQAEREAWIVDSTGERAGGAAAMNRALQELPRPWRTLARLYRVPPFGWLEDALYRWVATHRRLLSRLIKESECAVFVSETK